VNVLGTLNTIRAFLADMERENRGQLVAMCSIAGFCGETYGTAYCTTKFAVRGMMESLRMELRDRGLEGIVCTTLCPYFVRTPMVLEKGIRPTSRLIPFMSVEKCARRAIDAILKEKVLAFIPGWIFMIPMFNSMFSLRMQKTGRDYLNCRYEPAPICTKNGTLVGSSHTPPTNGSVSHEATIGNGNQKHGCEVDTAVKGQFSPTRAMSSYFKSPHPLWVVIIPPALLLTFLSWYSPTSVRVWWLGWLGQLAHYLGQNYNYGMGVVNLFGWAAHATEAIYSLHLCDDLKLAHSCALKWFLQTFVYGFFSLRLLLAYRANRVKKT